MWFGERLDPREFQRVETFLEEGPVDVVISVGTTAAFGYIVDPVARASRGGAWHVDVNPEPNPLADMADEVRRGRGVDELPKLLAH